MKFTSSLVIGTLLGSVLIPVLSTRSLAQSYPPGTPCGAIVINGQNVFVGPSQSQYCDRDGTIQNKPKNQSNESFTPLRQNGSYMSPLHQSLCNRRPRPKIACPK
jgi:hypothetical protein